MNNDEKYVFDLINQIKADVYAARNQILRESNKTLLQLYWSIGKKISENTKYGEFFVESLEKSLKIEFPYVRGFSRRNLFRMEKFYNSYKEFEKMPPAVALLPWTHNCLLIDKIEDFELRMWYADQCLKEKWNKDALIFQLDTNLHLRNQIAEKKTSNIKERIKDDSHELLLKNPYIFDIADSENFRNEKDIEKLMVSKIKDVMLELGKGFTFVGNQYKISMPNTDYFIDLLFYNIELHCYVVIEIKNTEFKPEYVGQIQFYVTAVNETMKRSEDNETIGLLLCKSNDTLTVNYSLKGTNIPLGISDYKISKYLPTKEELEKYLN